MKYKIGVLGSFKQEDEDVMKKSRKIGEIIAKNGCITLTGSGGGVPHEAIKSAKENNGFTVGISPANDLEEHKENKLPTEGFDMIIFTGFGYKGRNVITVRSCDAAIFISGGSGTLNDFTIAYDEGKLCGVLLGTGGITTIVKDLENIIKDRKSILGTVIYDSDPEKLVERVIKTLEEEGDE